MAGAAAVEEVELKAMGHSSARSKTKPGRRHKGEPECHLSRVLNRQAPIESRHFTGPKRLRLCAAQVPLRQHVDKGRRHRAKDTAGPGGSVIAHSNTQGQTGFRQQLNRRTAVGSR